MEVTSEELFDHGINRFYLKRGNIAVVTAVGDVKPATIDVYSDLMIDTLNNYPDPNVTYMILHLTGAELTMTNYSRQRSMDIVRSIAPGRRVYLAGIFTNPTLATFIAVFLRTALYVLSVDITYRSFPKPAEAADWLEQQQNKNYTHAEI